MMVSKPFAAALVVLIIGWSMPLLPSAQFGDGSIAGVVLDPDGSPRPDLAISVTVSSVDGTPGDVGLVQRTDAGGRYRISGIAPGQYRVGIGICPPGVIESLGSCSHVVYHPGTEIRDAAAVVAVAAGAAVEGVDVVLDAATVTTMQDAVARLQAHRQGLWQLRRDFPPAPATLQIDSSILAANWSSIEEMHAHVVAAFVATPGMGSGRMGPMSLRVDRWTRLLLSGDESGGTSTTAWVLGTLDLIGMAVHDPPAVFSRASHGTYARAGRVLTPFEEQALAALRSGRDVVDRLGTDGRHVMGAIRAATACLTCHDTSREGDVLGAFHYVLSSEDAR